MSTDATQAINQLLNIVGEMREQIYQMQGMFDDEDGEIRSVIEKSFKVERIADDFQKSTRTQ